MSLQRRLTLFFVLIVILPLLAAGFILQRVIVGEISRRAVLSLRPALDATVAIYNRQADSLDRRVRSSVEDDPRFARFFAANDPTSLDAYLENRLDESLDLDFLLALGPRGEVLGFASKPPTFLPGFRPPAPSVIAEAEPGASKGFQRTAAIPVAVRGQGRQGHIIGGFWLDEDLLFAASRSGVDLSIVSEDRVVASTARIGASFEAQVDYLNPFELDLGEVSEAAATKLGGGMGIVASTPAAPIGQLSRQVLNSMLALLVLALLATTGLAYLLARLITQPLDELSEGAHAISEGRFDHRIPVRSKDEVGKLAVAFNEMTGQLSQTISALSSSRDQMQRAVRRVGETLRSTHDMKQMLDSILNTAADAVNAEAAVLWMLSPARGELHPGVARGIELDALGRVKVGDGVVGHVAERRTGLLVPDGASAAVFSRHEPRFPVAAAVPVFTQDRVMGVLAAYRKDASRPFAQEDFDTVAFLAEQGGVAVENVRLHEEAQRLSLTDGLTGVWNRRFFQMQFRQVLATATRFDRRFSVLMMDLDHFKQVNDRHGHQRGDALLIEFSHRVTQLLREVDTFARYGGEEFICLLSETDVQGAMTTAEKIHDAIKGTPFGSMDDELINLTVSIGVAAYPDHGDSFRSLVEAADQALYRAKQTGRDRVCLAGQPNLSPVPLH
ncbi:MAG: diguanylate cyclase [Actinomycetota bacterium]|nr:diguanylate cyclase [Actinomycetota bacterium]